MGHRESNNDKDEVENIKKTNSDDGSSDINKDSHKGTFKVAKIENKFGL